MPTHEKIIFQNGQSRIEFHLRKVGHHFFYKLSSIVVKILRKGKIKIKKDAVVSIQNIVSSINLGGKVNLEQAARTLPRSMYEPEQFPGLIHRMLDPKTVILLFASGKLVCTGAKKEADVYRSVHNLHSTLEEKELMIYDA